MIQRRTIGGGEGMENFFGGQMLVGRVRLDKQAVGGNLLEGFALLQFSLVQKVAGETEIRAEPGERWNHFRRAAVTVQHETAFGPGIFLQQFQHPPPRLQAVDAHGQISFGGKLKLRDKNFLLTIVAQAGLPAVETNFADGTRDGIEKLFQIRQPVRRAFAQIPRVITEAGNDLRSARGDARPTEFAREGEHLRPVRFTRAVHDHAGNAGFFARDQQFVLPTGETVVLQMIVRVVEFHFPLTPILSPSDGAREKN